MNWEWAILSTTIVLLAVAFALLVHAITKKDESEDE